MTKTLFRIENPGLAVTIAVLLLFLAVFFGLGLFAWWAFSWTTHTLVWFIFIFGSVLGSVRIKSR